MLCRKRLSSDSDVGHLRKRQRLSIFEQTPLTSTPIQKQTRINNNELQSVFSGTNKIPELHLHENISEVFNTHSSSSLPIINPLDPFQDASDTGVMCMDNLCAKENGLFTYKQVQSICSEKLKVQESQIREEYDRLLQMKLAEQYDVFVKFTFDNIRQQYKDTPTYIS